MDRRSQKSAIGLGALELSSLNVLRVDKMFCSLFHDLFRNNEATREMTIEEESDQ